MYGGVPPFTFNVIVPLHKPAQVAFVITGLSVIAVGWVIDVVSVYLQPLASVTTKVYLFAQRALPVSLGC